VRELRLGDGPLEVVLLPEAGARLHRLRAFGHDLLRTPSDPREHLRDPFFWGGYVMAPWCGRIAAEPVRVGARTVKLAPNFPDGTAIHGQVYVAPWTVDADGSTLRCAGDGNGWPWAYEAALACEVWGTGMRLRLSVRNRSDEPMPAGIGIHPWWVRPLQLSVDARSVYPVNSGSPADPMPVRAPLDLRTLAEPPLGLDATWSGIGPGAVQLSWPQLGVAAEISCDPSSANVVVASPPEPDATAVEMQTHAPDGMRRLLNHEPGAMALLPPAGELALELRLSFRRL